MNQCFKIKVSKPLLKKTHLDLHILVNSRSISNFPFLSKILIPKHLRNKLTFFFVTLASSTTVRNLIFKEDMSSNITMIRSILSQGDAENLIYTFVTSRLDYCNVLWAGCPSYCLSNLQLIQNAAVIMLTGISRIDHISHSTAPLPPLFPPSVYTVVSVIQKLTIYQS